MWDIIISYDRYTAGQYKSNKHMVNIKRDIYRYVTKLSNYKTHTHKYTDKYDIDWYTLPFVKR